MNTDNKNEAAQREATAWFVKLDAGEVSNSAKVAFFTWLDKSPANQNAYIEIEKLWGKLEIARKIPLQTSTLPNSWVERFFGPTGAFVSAAVVIGLVALFYLLPTQPTEYYYATALGERGDFRLEDGSLLQLNTNSVVTVRMEKSRRLLTLQRGEAYFDIAHNAARPLLVVTNGGMVRVLGTRFNIRQTSEGSIVSVIEGLVAVTGSSDSTAMASPNFQAAYTLSANQQAQLVENTAIASPTHINSDTVLAWRAGKLVYEGNTLTEVVRDLNRYFPGTIRLAEPSLGDLEIVGVLNLRNRSATLAALEATFGVEVVEVSDQLTLIRSGESPPAR